jgi:Ca2+-binding RTX toxin-like protein
MCPPLIGTQKDDIIIATAVSDATIYGLDGNDFIQCGPGACKAFAGPGNNILVAGLVDSDTSKLYGGSGNNIFIGGTGNSLMVGGKGNDQFYAGSGHDVMIGGGANFFDCGISGNGVILDFNPANGDTKASNCKFVITVHTTTSNNNPGATLS